MTITEQYIERHARAIARRRHGDARFRALSHQITDYKSIVDPVLAGQADASIAPAEMDAARADAARQFTGPGIPLTC